MSKNHVLVCRHPKRKSIGSLALLALVGSAVGLYAAECETFTGVASTSGTYKRPLLIVDGKRYELKASSDKADASVTDMLGRFSKGDSGTCVVKGTPGAVNGVDGIIDGITPAAIPPAAAQTTPTVTSSVVTVSNRKYTVYDYADPATKRFCVVIPEDLKTVRGLQERHRRARRRLEPGGP
jgi:hypothetical protein